MTPPPSTRKDRVAELTERHLDDTATDAERHELSDLLASDATAARRFARATLLDGLLQYALRSEARPQARTGDDPNVSPRPRWPRQGRVALVLAAAAALALAVIAPFVVRTGKAEPAAEGAAPWFASIDAQIGAEWRTGVHADGFRLSEGTYELRRGLARLRFPDGAVAIMHGPATFGVGGDHDLTLRTGTIAVECRTEASVGFSVGTDRFVATDLSTEFVVRASGPRQGVHVVQGAVRVTPAGGDRPQRDLHAGEALIADGTGWSVVRATLDDVTLASAFDDVLDAANPAPPRGMAAYKELVRDSDGLLAWLSMNDAVATASADSLTHRVTVGPRNPAEPHTPRLVSGRFSGDRSVEVSHRDDALRLDIDGEFERLTLAAWMRLHPVDHETEKRQRAILFPDDQYEAGRIQWHVRGGALRLWASVGEIGWGVTVAASGIDLRDGRWHFVTTVIDRDDAGVVTVSHFANGREITRASVGDDIPPVRLGPSTVGGWTKPAEADRAFVSALAGQIDELLIWSRALSETEIRTLHRMTSHNRAPHD